MDKTAVTEILLNVDIPGMNFARGLQRFNGNAEVYVRILRTFAKSMPASLDKLRNVSTDTLPDYVTLIHGLKGSCYGVNADEAGKLAESLEIAGKKNDLAYVLDNTDAFILTIKALLLKLEELFRLFDGQPESKPKNKAPDRALLSELLTASQEYDIEAIGQTLEKLTKYDYETEKELVLWLKEQADIFAYDAIQEKLTALLSD